MTHIILFLAVAVGTSLVCTLLKTREAGEILCGTARFSSVLVAGIFLLALLVQVAQVFGGTVGLAAIAAAIAAGIAYHYLRPTRKKSEE